MKYASNDIEIFEKINGLIVEGMIVPYDDYLLEFLANHTNCRDRRMIKSNYLDTLCSTYSVGENPLFTRYLALGMRGEFKLCTGTFNAVDTSNKQYWIETEEFVYDVSFIGKYPKALYYELFKPVNIEVIDLEKDYDFKNIKNTQAKEKKDTYYLKYFDWHLYMKLANHFNPFGRPKLVPELIDFPQFKSKEEEMPDNLEVPTPIENDKSIDSNNTKSALHKHIETEWKKRTAITVIPSELFSPLLEKWIRENIPLYLENYPEYTIETIYSGLIKFIVRERSLYESKKYDLDDITLWKKAMSEYSKHYSCLVGEAISIIPFILELEREKCVYIKHHTPPNSQRYIEFKNKYALYDSPRMISKMR